MTLEQSIKLGLVDISTMHILRRKKQSPERAVKKILDSVYSIYPEFPIISENDPELEILKTLIISNDFSGIRSFVIQKLSI